MGTSKDFSSLAMSTIPNYHALDTGVFFPLYIYEEPKEQSDSPSLFDEPKKPNLVRRDAITNEGYNHFKEAYPSEQFNKEDIFYYIYGLLHSEDYRTRFADNLSKELPRIPCVKKAEDFWAFSKAGRDLAHWHLDYETIEPYKAKIESKRGNLTEEQFYQVEKMKYASKEDKTRLVYNPYITVSEIPLEAYEYVVNGKPALDWVVERQCVKSDKESGIVNDANLWATETMENPAYPLELFLRVITVSLETMKIVKNLPSLDI